MAVTWELKITPIDIANYVASIKATRTDGVSGAVSTYDVVKAVIETEPQQIAAMDEIWAKHQAAVAATAAVTAFISAKEAAGKTNLEARE